jgi:hypothetical protein
VTLIPYPIPIADRMKLMDAGRAAVEAMAHGKATLWQQRHARVEQITATIVAKYGIEEQENESATV